jgi:hypothetical protein
MDAGMVMAICVGVAAIIRAATPVVIEVLRQRSKRRSEMSQDDEEVRQRSLCRSLIAMMA